MSRRRPPAGVPRARSGCGGLLFGWGKGGRAGGPLAAVYANAAAQQAEDQRFGEELEEDGHLPGADGFAQAGLARAL